MEKRDTALTICLYYRKDLFIQSKLWNSNHRPEHVRPDLEATPKDLKLDYIDSYIIHWPMPVPSKGNMPLTRHNGSYLAHQTDPDGFRVIV